MRNGADEEKATTHPAGGEVTCFIDACLFRCCESKRSRICSTATQASSWPPSSPPSSARESFPWLFVVTAIVLCFLLEAVIVALVHVLLGVLLCAIWPSSTAAAIASLILRPAATIDRNPATPSASEEPPRDVRVGDCVVRRGELCTVIAIDRSVVPIGVTVQNQKTGMVAHTELAFLSLPADCTATPPPTLPPPRLPLLRLLMLPLYAVALTSLAVLTRAVMLPLYLLRFTNLVRLIRLIGRSYRSDEAGDGPATQVVCNGRGGQECRSPNRPALVHVKGINKKTEAANTPLHGGLDANRGHPRRLEQS